MRLNKKHNTWMAGIAVLCLVTGVAAMPLTELKTKDADSTQAIATANGLSAAFRSVSRKLLPSVVAIENTPKAANWNGGKPSGQVEGTQQNPFKGTPFEDMFKGRKSQTPPNKPQPRGGIGSGVIVDKSGIIITNNHVVAGGGEVKVRLHDGREFVATDVWTDPKTDIAVVKIAGAADLVAADMGDSDDALIGDWVLALGQPYGLESTVTAGIISAKHRGIGLNDRENYLQTDAAINPGNSGGPLVNLNGEIVGINTAISSRSGGNDGIGFAVPINLAKWVSDQLVANGEVHRAYLGVGIQPVTHDLAEHLNVKPRGGVAVTDVFPDTPAAKSGLQSGDVIVEFADRTVASPQELQIAVERAVTGETLPLRIVRDGKHMTLAFTAEARPGTFGTKSEQKTKDASSSRQEELGLEIRPLTEDVAKGLGMKGTEGLVVTAVRSSSPAAKAGLQAGMVIKQVNRKPVSTVAELQKAIESDGEDGLLLLIKTSTGSRFVVINA